MKGEFKWSELKGQIKKKSQLKVRRGRKQVRKQTAEITFSHFGEKKNTEARNLEL